MAEIAISILSKQYLDRRILTLSIITKEIIAWEATINALHKNVKWHFTTDDARVKLIKLYPVI